MTDIILNALGGLALFMLAMTMMTDGLKRAAGTGLKRWLQSWTGSALRGVLGGALLTALVQSSSAVTVAVIGFVNAGILTLKQALGVIFGANLGTTATGWLVSLIGLDFKIEALTMPMLAVGVGLQFMPKGKRLRGTGQALTGLALFFLGLGILKDGFAGLADAYGTSLMLGQGTGGVIGMVGVGIVATILTQSSSAAMAIVLMAASQNVIGIEAAAAATIGANLGTTSTAVFASLKATPNARRVAVGHVVFNLFTGIVAIALLPVMLALISKAEAMIGLAGAVPFLALFHSLFNLMGLVLMLPFTSVLARRLDELFRTEEEDISKPRHLDYTLAETPALAIPAMMQELNRLQDLTVHLVQDGMGGVIGLRKLQGRSEAIVNLGHAVSGFGINLRMDQLSREDAETLPNTLRLARYFEQAAQLVPDVSALMKYRKSSPCHAELAQVQATASTVLDGFADNKLISMDSAEMDAFQLAYQAAKSALLRQAVNAPIQQDDVDTQLQQLSHLRRMMEQLCKASEMIDQQTEAEVQPAVPEPPSEGANSPAARA